MKLRKNFQLYYLKVSACGVGKCKMQMLHAPATDKPVPVAKTELVLHHRHHHRRGGEHQTKSMLHISK